MIKSFSMYNRTLSVPYDNLAYYAIYVREGMTMNMFPVDMMVLEAITRLVSHEPKTRISYEQIESSLQIPLSIRSIQRSVARLEHDAHLRRVGGMSKHGYIYELSTSIRMEVSICG